MKALRRYAPLIGLLVFGGLVWLGVYAYQDGFTKKWRKLIVKEFLKHDLNIHFDTLTIDPFQGLVANNVTLLDKATLQEIAHVSQARLDLDLAKLIRKERFLERIELDSANLSLPYDRSDPESNRLELQDLQATVILPNGRIEIVNAEADFYGLKINLTGTLLRPPNGSPESINWRSEKVRAARPALEMIADQLKHLESRPNRPPVMRIVLSGDLTKPETLEMKTRFDGTDLEYYDVNFAEAEAEAILSNELLTLSNLQIRDADGGRLTTSGKFPLKGKREGSFTLNSTLTLDPLVRATSSDGSWWSGLTFAESPTVSMQGTLRPNEKFRWTNPPVDLIGRLETKGFQLEDERFDSFSTDFHIQGERFFARNLHVKHPYGESTGKLIRSPAEGLHYSFVIGMDPTILQKLPLTDGAADFLKRWEFRPNSGIHLKLEGGRDAQDAATWEHQGTATLSECRFETVELERLHTEFTLNPHAHHFSNLEARVKGDPARSYSGGTVTAQRVSVSARDYITMLTDVRGFIDPGQIVRCFDTKSADVLDTYRFSQAPEIHIPSGTVDPKSSSQTNLQVEVKSNGNLVADVFGEQVPFDQPRFGLRFLKDSLFIRLDHAGLLGGNLVGNGEIRDLASTRDYTSKVAISEVSFEKLAEIYFPDYQGDGQLSGTFSWRGRGSALDTVDGMGSVHLRDSSLLEVPVLEPFSALIDRVLGKTERRPETIRELGTEFAVQSSTVSLSSTHANLGDYHLHGHGSIDLPTSDVELEISLLSASTSGAVLDVLYEMFGTYQCSGTLEKPKWTMVHRFSPREQLDAVRKLLDAQKTHEPETNLLDKAIRPQEHGQDSKSPTVDSP